MSLQFTTKAVLRDGDLLVSVPRAFDTALLVLLERSALKTAGYLTVKLDTPHRPRSTGWKSQNHHLRGHVRQLCDYTGYTMSEMMQVVKEDTPTWPVEYKVIRGKRRMLHVSEADISVEVASEAIEICHRFAGENGWTLYEGGDNEPRA